MTVIIIYQPQLINSQVITDSLQSKNSSFYIGTIDNKSFSNNSLADYTLMIYMVGSDIEARAFSATDDILEIQKIGSNPKVNVLLETGGGSDSTTKSEKRFIDFTQVQRHVLNNYTFTMEDNLKKQNMGDPKTLSDFIVWGISKYPAKKYAIIFWDHGSGINGFGGELQFKNDILRGAEINKAFSDAKIITNKKFELIGFDACLMSSIEIADKVKAHG